METVLGSHVCHFSMEFSEIFWWLFHPHLQCSHPINSQGFGVFWCPGVPGIYRGQQQFFGIQTSGRFEKIFPTHLFCGKNRKMAELPNQLKKARALEQGTQIPLWFFGFRKWWSRTKFLD